MKGRRYLFALVDGGGNVPPELSAVRRLVERGHVVTVLAEDSVAGEVRATGARLRPWVKAPNRPDHRPENDPARDWECRYPWQLITRRIDTLFVGPAPAYAHDVRDAIADTRPHLVICSMFCLGGMVAVEAAGLPFDVLLPNVYPLPAKGLPPFGVGLQPARGAVGRLRDRALNAFIERLWDSKGLTGLNLLPSGMALGRRRLRLAVEDAERDYGPRAVLRIAGSTDVDGDGWLTVGGDSDAPDGAVGLRALPEMLAGHRVASVPVHAGGEQGHADVITKQGDDRVDVSALLGVHEGLEKQGLARARLAPRRTRVTVQPRA